MKILIFVFCLVPFSLYGQKLIHIPDSNFLRVLKERGYVTRDSLNPKKTTGLLQLMIGNNNIEDLSGIEYFTQVWNLKISGNSLRDLKHLPPRITNLDCSRNKLSTLEGLPETLKGLNCSDNVIETIRDLPSNLKWLHFSNNLVSSLPSLPASLQHVNYFGNPIDPATLPEQYNLVNCENAIQNCLPNSLIKWNILRNNFLFNEVPDIKTIEVSLKSNYSWGAGTLSETWTFRRAGNNFSSSEITHHRVKDDLDTVRG
jgi:Leucine-rich repeat (LRR) protein